MIPLRPLLLLIPIQLIAFGTVIVLHHATSGAIAGLPALAIDSGAAGLMSFLLRHSRPWIALNALVPPMTFLSLGGGISWEAFPFIAFLLALVYLPTLWTRVPFYPTSREMENAILSYLPLDRRFTFIDLGCGFATLIAHLAEERPLGRFVGVEISPLPLSIGKLRAGIARHRNLEVRFESLWRVELSSFDIIYCFLAPPPMEELWKKVSSEARPGAIFLDNSFPVPAEADERIPVHDRRNCVLYVHRMGNPG